jgi:hypothetical protein
MLFYITGGAPQAVSGTACVEANWTACIEVYCSSECSLYSGLLHSINIAPPPDRRRIILLQDDKIDRNKSEVYAAVTGLTGVANSIYVDDNLYPK